MDGINNNVDLKEQVCEIVDWIQLAHVRVKQQAIWQVMMNFFSSTEVGNFLIWSSNKLSNPNTCIPPRELIRLKEGDIWEYPTSNMWLWDGSRCARSGVGNTAKQNDNPCTELLVYCVILVSLGMCMSLVRSRVALRPSQTIAIYCNKKPGAVCTINQA